MIERIAEQIFDMPVYSNNTTLLFLGQLCVEKKKG